MKYIHLILATLIFVFIFIPQLLEAQVDFITEEEILKKASENFANIKDYKAIFTWKKQESIQKGQVFFKNPGRIRLDFTDPKGNVICSDGYVLHVYIDSLKLVLKQQLVVKEDEEDNEDNANEEEKDQQQIITEEKTEIDLAKTQNPLLIAHDLSKLIKTYRSQFFGSRDLVKYKDDLKVYQLELKPWKMQEAGFKKLQIWIQPNGVIRKVVGITPNYEKITMEFDDITLNTNIPDSKFDYESPPYTNLLDNFLIEMAE